MTLTIREGRYTGCSAGILNWSHADSPGDIIAYRVAEPAPAEPPCDGKPGGEWMAQQLAEKDARIKDLAGALCEIAGLLDRMFLLHPSRDFREVLPDPAGLATRIRLLLGPTTPPAEQPKLEAETFEQWLRRRFPDYAAQDAEFSIRSVSVRDISDYLALLEQRLGREGE